jgi:cytochrome c553
VKGLRSSGTSIALLVGMQRRSLLALAILAACAPASGGTEDNGRVKYHMRERARDLRTIERMLVHGQLELAKTLAFMLTHPPSLPESPEARDVVLAASSLSTARNVEDALYAASRIANACARCHVKMQQVPVFPLPSHAPAERPALDALMVRHEWAVDRLWEGVIGDSDAHWRAGLYALATSPLPSTINSPELARQLQSLARAAYDQKQPATIDERTELYGKLLTVCARCHATTVAKSPLR